MLTAWLATKAENTNVVFRHLKARTLVLEKEARYEAAAARHKVLHKMADLLYAEECKRTLTDNESCLVDALMQEVDWALGTTPIGAAPLEAPPCSLVDTLMDSIFETAIRKVCVRERLCECV